jgi:hypothetical protein
MKRLLIAAIIVLGVLAPIASAAMADSSHDSSEGSGHDASEDSGHGTTKEPFRIELTKGLPESAVKSTFENGVITLDVKPSHTLAVLGIEDEEFIRVDKDGMVSVLTTSMTYEMADLSVASPEKAEDLGDGWSAIGSGMVTYHEHRSHFMAANVDPAIKDGGIVSTFELGFIVDDEPATVTGNLVFDPSMNPNRAAELSAPADPKMMNRDAHDHSHRSSTPWFLVIGVPAVFFIALGSFILKNRRRAS